MIAEQFLPKALRVTHSEYEWENAWYVHFENDTVSHVGYKWLIKEILWDELNLTGFAIFENVVWTRSKEDANIILLRFS